MNDNENLICRLEIIADEMKDLKRYPMEASIREAISLLRSNSSERSFQPMVSRHEVIFTKAEALLVKTWYIHGATMRRVSELIAEHFPEKQCNGDNQIEGRFILQESGEILNEDWNKWK